MRYLQKNFNNVLRFTPEARPLSATLDFVASSGAIISSPIVTLDSFSRTILSVANFSFIYDDSAGTGAPVAGRQYWILSETEPEFLITVSKVNGTTVSYENKPAGTIAADAVMMGADLTATILAASVANVGLNYQFRWTVTLDVDVRVYLETGAVCRTVFLPPMTAIRAAAHVAIAFPKVAASRPAQYWIDMATRASRRIESLIISSGKLPHLCGEQSLLEEPGFISLQIELLRDGLIPAGFDGPTFKQSCESDLKREMEIALSSIWHDDSQSGTVEPSEIRGPKSIRLRRV